MDASLEGCRGAQFQMVIEVGKVREFARATKSSNPKYVGDAEPISPVTFLAAAAFWQDVSSSPWGDVPRDFQRILHGEQEFVFFGEPPKVGTVLSGQARLDRIYEKSGRRGGVMTFAEVVTEFRDESGSLVAESRSTVIETSPPPPGHSS